MAETELRGTINLDADTREAERKLRQFSRREGDRTGAELGRRAGGGLSGITQGAMAGNIARRSMPALGRAASGVAGGAAAGTIARTLPKLGGLGAAGAVPALAIGIPLAAAAAGKALHSFAKRTQESNRRLAEASPGMAATVAMFDMRMRLINMRIGNQVAPSAARLNNEFVDLARQTSGIQVMFRRAFNETASDVTRGLSSVMAGLQGIPDHLLSIPGLRVRGGDDERNRPGLVEQVANPLMRHSLGFTLSQFLAVRERAGQVNEQRSMERVLAVQEDQTVLLEGIRDNTSRMSMDDMKDIVEANQAIIGIVENIRSQQDGEGVRNRDEVHFDEIVRDRQRSQEKAEDRLREFEKEMEAFHRQNGGR